MRIAIALLLSLVITLLAACGGGGVGSVTLDDDSRQMMKTSLVISSGLKVNAVEAGRAGITISYEQKPGDTDGVLLQRAVNMATVAVGFLDEPATIKIVSMLNGKAVSEVTINGGDLAALLIGERSLDETLSKIKLVKK
jgi:hypothetical protein